MIIQNGYIEVKTKKGGGIDPVNGFPLPVEVSWGRPVPCQYVPNRHNNLGRTAQEGHFTVASYSVYIEEQPFSAEQIRLSDMSGTNLGEFSIIQVEPLVAVGEIRITV